MVQRFVGLEEEHEMRDGFMDTASVLLLPSKKDAKVFLNLSPFIIDKNAFVEKSNESKLHYFDRYEKAVDAYSFKHIYKPDDLPLVVNREEHFEVIKAQFNAFAVSLFNKPMKDL